MLTKREAKKECFFCFSLSLSLRQLTLSFCFNKGRIYLRSFFLQVPCSLSHHGYSRSWDFATMEHVHHCSCSKYITCICQREDGVPQKASYLKHQDGRWRRGRHIHVKAEARPASYFTHLSM